MICTNVHKDYGLQNVRDASVQVVRPFSVAGPPFPQRIATRTINRCLVALRRYLENLDDAFMPVHRLKVGRSASCSFLLIL